MKKYLLSLGTFLLLAVLGLAFALDHYEIAMLEAGLKLHWGELISPMIERRGTFASAALTISTATTAVFTFLYGRMGEKVGQITIHEIMDQLIPAPFIYYLRFTALIVPGLLYPAWLLDWHYTFYYLFLVEGVSAFILAFCSVLAAIASESALFFKYFLWKDVKRVKREVKQYQCRTKQRPCFPSRYIEDLLSENIPMALADRHMRRNIYYAERVGSMWARGRACLYKAADCRSPYQSTFIYTYCLQDCLAFYRKLFEVYAGQALTVWEQMSSEIKQRRLDRELYTHLLACAIAAVECLELQELALYFDQHRSKLTASLYFSMLLYCEARISDAKLYASKIFMLARRDFVYQSGLECQLMFQSIALSFIFDQHEAKHFQNGQLLIQDLTCGFVRPQSHYGRMYRQLSSAYIRREEHK